jgi:glycosyltransferase involved in cell wall biosynthesis
MKLLILDQFSDPGGAQQGLLDLLPAFRERGWDAIVAMPGAGRLFADVRQLGFRVETMKCGPYASGRKTLGDLLRFARDTAPLARHIAGLAQGVDLVYVNGPRVLPAAALAHVAAPLVFHAHSFLGPGLPRMLAGRSLRRAQASVIANCEFVAAPWREYVGDVRVIYNGVGNAPRHRTVDGPPRVACLGRIAPEKGHLEFVDAAALIHAARPDCRFTIYGDALFSEPGVEQYAREVRAHAAGLPVEFTGWVDDPAAALAETDLLLVPSTLVEATTRVILEAYAAGTPVIAFGNGGIPEVVDDGRTGRLVRSVEEMARAAIDLLADPARRVAMSAAARECWEQRFTLERYRGEMIEALETARRRRAPAAPLP